MKITTTKGEHHCQLYKEKEKAEENKKKKKN